jgi:hypothetical protein
MAENAKDFQKGIKYPTLISIFLVLSNLFAKIG